MRSTIFAFMRGSCHLFYDRLPQNGLFKTAPLAWCCGDLHLENFGSYKGDNRLVYFDLNDFDEAALAPATWELLRMLTSLRIGAVGLGVKALDIQKFCQIFLQSYAVSLASGKANWVERETAQGLVRGVIDGLGERGRAAFLDARTHVKGKKRALRVDGKKALPATDEQRDAVSKFMRGFAKMQVHPDFYEVLDVARRIAGTGSLGVERFVILVQGKGSPDGNYLLDLKQALPSSLVPHLKVAQPVWETQAHRVVAVQRRMQAVAMAFLHPVMFDDKPCVLRGLQPSEDRVALDQPGLSLSDWTLLVQTLGQLVAWAQLRSSGRNGSAIADELMDFGSRPDWSDHLLQASVDCAQQVRADAALFNAAYDAGAL
jgi:uncharacterized protein (DUF2252 family)